jgi:hypothetical protein
MGGTIVAPLVNKQIEDVLKPPISIFQRREETKQKHYAELLAIEEDKLALKWEHIR